MMKRHNLPFGIVTLLAIGTSAVPLTADPNAPSSPQQSNNLEQEEVADALAEELFRASTPESEEQGEWQFSTTVDFTDSDEQWVAQLLLEAEVGLTDRFQIGVEVPLTWFESKYDEEDEYGLGDVEIEFLYNFVRSDRWVVSAAFGLGLPTGDEDRELGEGVVEYEPMLVAAYYLDATAFYLNLGGEISEDDSSFDYALAIAHAWDDLVGVVEYTGSTWGEEEPHVLTPGVLWHGFDDMEIGVGVPIGLSDDAADWGVIFRLTFEFN